MDQQRIGFDYLRDNMAMQVGDRFQRKLELRDCRRSRLDPDRRGAHAAHHFRRAEDRTKIYSE